MMRKPAFNGRDGLHSRWKSGFVVVLALTLFCPTIAGAEWLRTAAGTQQQAQQQSCEVLCGQGLARCERSKDRTTPCARHFQMCKEDCAAPAPQRAFNRRITRQQQCVQQCDLSASLCDQGAALRPAHCITGVAQCKARC